AGFSSVRLLTTTRGKTKPADSPTAANIEKALVELMAGRASADTGLIAFSGPGVQLEGTDPAGQGPAKAYRYLCPTDADLFGVDYETGRSKTLIHLDDLFKQLGEKCGAGRKLVLMDACRNELEVKGTARSLYVKRDTISRGVGALFSCSEG